MTDDRVLWELTLTCLAVCGVLLTIAYLAVHKPTTKPQVTYCPQTYDPESHRWVGVFDQCLHFQKDV